MQSSISGLNSLDINDRAEASEDKRSDGSGGKPSQNVYASMLKV